MEVSNEKQAIAIADLGVDQLTHFQRQLDQEIAFLTESLKVATLIFYFQMYIPAKVVDPKNHLIEIGTGYFVEMDTEKAVDFFRRKQGFLKKQMEVIEGVLPEKYRARNAIVDNLQKKINVQMNNVNTKK
uniref:BMA-PFD-5, isoform b n=1 Tax=Brugia malayi TaxID=6279 RepID=A0A0J9Y6G3_BRUMA|nr:BMA-PFD-5, isoform b [Brugia malayi]